MGLDSLPIGAALSFRKVALDLNRITSMQCNMWGTNVVRLCLLQSLVQLVIALLLLTSDQHQDELT